MSDVAFDTLDTAHVEDKSGAMADKADLYRASWIRTGAIVAASGVVIAAVAP